MVQSRPNAITADDLHRVKNNYNAIVKRITGIVSTDPLDLQYINFAKYNSYLVEQNQKTMLSAKMSLEQAGYFIEFYKSKPKRFETINLDDKEFVSLISDYWNYVCTRGKIHRTQKVKTQSTKKLSLEGLNKAKQQLQLFLKYVKFKVENPEMHDRSFNYQLITLPDKIRLTLTNPLIKKNKTVVDTDVIPLSKFKDFVDSLDIKHYRNLMLSAVLVILSETGRRYTELMSVKLKSLHKTNGYITLEMEHSKTYLRGNILIYSLPYLERFLEIHPTPNDPEAPLFVNSKGKKMSYNNLRQNFANALDEYNKNHPNDKLIFPPGHKFHLVRHYTGTRFVHWPDALRRFYLGWAQEGAYSHYFEKNLSDNLNKCHDLLIQTYADEKNPFLENIPTTYLKKIQLDARDKEQEKLLELIKNMSQDKLKQTLMMAMGGKA